jgi:hypothetical protein
MARPGDPSESLQSEQVGEDSRECRRSIWSRLADYCRRSRGEIPVGVIVTRRVLS